MLVFYLGHGRPLLRVTGVDSGVTWIREQDALRNDAQWGQLAHIARHADTHYTSPEFLAHMMFSHCGDHALSLMARVKSMSGLDLTFNVKGQKTPCHGCHRASYVPRNPRKH